MSNNKLTSAHFKPQPRHRRTPTSGLTTKKTLVHATQTNNSSIGWDDVAPADSFSSYMQHKNRKLRQQFASEFSSSPNTTSASKIFAGVVVWVNGHTQPSRLQIRRIMGQHGGQLETYCTSRVTHIVATHLATATRLRFTGPSTTARRAKLVSPQWITASLTHARRLPEIDYPIPFMLNPNQRSIKGFFAPSTSQTNMHSPKQTPEPK